MKNMDVERRGKEEKDKSEKEKEKGRKGECESGREQVLI